MLTGDLQHAGLWHGATDGAQRPALHSVWCGLRGGPLHCQRKQVSAAASHQHARSWVAFTSTGALHIQGQRLSYPTALRTTSMVLLYPLGIDSVESCLFERLQL